MTREFVEAYSDDQIHLEMLERLVEQNEMQSRSLDSIKYSSYSRLWSVMMVGAIECMINGWNKDDPMYDELYDYFGPQGMSNIERSRKLMQNLNRRNISIDEEKFKDFLAIKFIRNAYVHSGWRILEQQFVIARGFPKDLLSFDKSHFSRMKDSYYHVTMCLGFAIASKNI